MLANSSLLVDAVDCTANACGDQQIPTFNLSNIGDAGSWFEQLLTSNRATLKHKTRRSCYKYSEYFFSHRQQSACRCTVHQLSPLGYAPIYVVCFIPANRHISSLQHYYSLDEVGHTTKAKLKHIPRGSTSRWILVQVCYESPRTWIGDVRLNQKNQLSV